MGGLFSLLEPFRSATAPSRHTRPVTLGVCLAARPNPRLFPPLPPNPPLTPLAVAKRSLDGREGAKGRFGGEEGIGRWQSWRCASTGWWLAGS